MTRRWLAVLALAVVGAGGVALLVRHNAAAPVVRSATATTTTPTERPRLALLTSLPLVFGETFALDSPRSAALDRLDQAYRVDPIGVADAASLAGHRLLLMAHPRAQPAEVLVELDAWVRGGGRVVLLADPRLDWHSERPLGDRLRPPPDFADTGLLKRWGLTLDGPVADGPRVEHGGGYDIMTVSPGALSSASTACVVEAGRLVAHCRIGRGAVTVIADADFLNVSGEGAIDGPTEHNLDLLVSELSRRQSR